MKTFTITSQRIPRPVLIGIAVLFAAFAALMIVRVVHPGGPSSTAAAPPAPAPAVLPVETRPTPNAKPRIALLPDLPVAVAHALRYSKVVVVSAYVGQAPGDHPAVTEARKGARSAGAGFVAVNVGSDKVAAAFSSFIGPVTPPAMLIVRRPGRILTRISGQVESAIVAQAAYNAGARR
ncbi:MAG: hypothetical protein EXQ81_00715 [Thermoleophilia bacterium]|nr:hypothetical protein [Thermoleophilia bacterium]